MKINKAKHDGMIRGFYHLTEAWYSEANLKDRTDGLIDNVMIGFYGPDGDQGTSGEFSVDWKRVGKRVPLRLAVYDDDWETLSHFSDLLAEMAKLDNADTSPTDFCELLTRLGIKDLTKIDSSVKEKK